MFSISLLSAKNISILYNRPVYIYIYIYIYIYVHFYLSVSASFEILRYFTDDSIWLAIKTNWRIKKRNNFPPKILKIQFLCQMDSLRNQDFFS